MGYKVVVVCMGSETSIEEVSPTLTIHRRKDIFLPDPLNFGISFGFSRYVQRIRKEVKPDLVIINKILFWPSFSAPGLRLRGVKILQLTDALVGMTWWPRTVIPRIIMACGAWTMGWLVLLCCKEFVTFHPQPPALLKRLGIAKKTRVIPTGIDPADWPMGERESGIPNPESRITVTYLGRLESVKGVEDFLEAAIPLKKDHPEMSIQVVGHYNDGHPLVEKYSRDAVFTGYKKEYGDILRSSDVFVLPSYSEGLSNALMESMCSGCACIASEVGGNRFLIENGISGFLFTPGDIDALRSHIRRLLEDSAKRKQLGLGARKRIEEHFSWTKVAKMYQELFDEFLS